MVKYRFASIVEFSSMRDNIKETISLFCPQGAELLYVALNEAVNNALFHGRTNGSTPNVEINLFRDSDEICIIVKHNGTGYSYKSRKKNQSADSYDEHGRGIEIIEYCTDTLKFNESGNELEMRKKIV